MAHPIRSLYPCLAALLVGAGSIATLAQQAPTPRAGATSSAAITGRLLDDRGGTVAHAVVRLVVTGTDLADALVTLQATDASGLVLRLTSRP